MIQLYIVGVFVSFTLSQTGMVRHWTRLLRTETEPAVRRRMVRSRVINAVGLVVTGIVLVVVLITKFTHGAWIAIAAMVVLFLLMKGIHRHYERVAAELVIDEDEDTRLPARTHAIVLVSKIHKPTMRAVNYARAMRPSTLEAVTVNVDREETRALQREWDRRNIPVPLKVLDSPFREVTDPVIDYVKSVRRGSPRDLVTVLIPEYVVGHWWEHLLHNQSALRLKGRLLFTPGVMVTSVPVAARVVGGPGGAARGDRFVGRPAQRHRPVRWRVLSGEATAFSGPVVGSSFVVRVGAVAHGGFCVARHEGRVIFVRHALPGELVRVTRDGGQGRTRPTGGPTRSRSSRPPTGASSRRARGRGRAAAAAATGSTSRSACSGSSRRRSCASSSPGSPSSTST